MKKGRIIRILLVVLMTMCGNASLFAIENGDIVTIRISSGANYLAENGNYTTNVQNTPKENCLWKVTKEGDNYSFESVSQVGTYLYVHKSLMTPTKSFLPSL